MVTLLTQPTTYEAYLAASQDNETVRVELLDGELIMSPAPLLIHQIVSANLLWLLSDYVRKNQLGYVLTAPIEVQLGDHIVQPDVLFVTTQKFTELKTKRGLKGAPDLVIEIISPSSKKRDSVDKLNLYAQQGIPEYWLVDPEERFLQVFVWQDGRYFVAGSFSGEDILNVGRFASAEIPMTGLFVNETK